MSLSSTSSNQDDKKRPISLPEAAELYGFEQRYLGKLARRGRLKAHKIGNMWVTTPRGVEEYIASRQKRGAHYNDINIPKDR
jgi:hypothetical protein